MVAKKIRVSEVSGLHLRPAGLLSKISLKYQSKIEIRKNDVIVNAKSILGVLSARVQQGDEIEIICDGIDEEEALEELIKAIREGFELTESQE